MFAVIFTAQIADLDADYADMATRMRELAMAEYGCTAFTSCTEDGREIAVSYWDNETQIARWRSNSEHLVAQQLGQSRWYKSYTVEVVEVVRSYRAGHAGI